MMNNKIDIIKDTLEKKDIKFAILFGSYARGEEKEHSDIDIAIRSPKENSVRHTLELRRELTKELGIKVEVFPIEELEEKTLGEIAYEGKPIIDKNKNWDNFYTKYKDKRETREEARKRFEKKYNRVIENA